MATEQAINIITGHTGIAHVSSADDAAIWSGFVGAEDVTLNTGGKLECNYSTAGELKVSAGVFCLNGHMGRIVSQTTVNYSLPATSGKYRRTNLIIRYANNSGIESMKLMTLQSSEKNTEEDAADESISLSSNDFLLYDFVCDENGVVSGRMNKKFTVIDTIPSLRSGLDTEKINRLNETTSLSSRLTSAEDNISSLGSSVEGVKFQKLSISNNSVSASYDIYVITVSYSGRNGTEYTTVTYDKSYGSASFLGLPFLKLSGSDTGICLPRFSIYPANSRITVSNNNSTIVKSFSSAVTTSISFSIVSAYGVKAINTAIS